MKQDELLSETIPSNTLVYRVKAIPQKITRIAGLGNLDFRALFHIFFKGNSLIKKHKIDLVYFSTRSNYLMPLGRLWWFLYKVPYLVDIHDPWFEKNTLNKPREERLPKHKLAYYTNMITESLAIKKTSGLIAVSEGILEDLKARYPNLKNLPSKTITFGAYPVDFEIKTSYKLLWENFKDHFIISYTGAYAPYMKKHFEILFSALKYGLKEHEELFKKVKVFCIGSNYCGTSLSEKKLEMLAEQYLPKNFVFEFPERVSYFHSILLMKNSNMLFLPGSVNKNYSSSKTFNYFLAGKPILTLQHKESDLIKFFNDIEYNDYIVDVNTLENLALQLKNKILSIIENKETLKYNIEKFQFYSAESQTLKQVNIFNSIVT